ncbi:MAG TPA: hypothetical protein VEV44_18815 [Pseudoneobacillus sp.]|nr:hypothetical protein [Pseudoneobacillus sp.]
MTVHEFGIIDDFKIRKDYGYYAPKEYKCISVSDDIIQNLSESIKIMKSYFRTFLN